MSTRDGARLKELEETNKMALLKLPYHAWFFRYVFLTAQTRYIAQSTVAAAAAAAVQTNCVLWQFWRVHGWKRYLLLRRRYVISGDQKMFYNKHKIGNILMAKRKQPPPPPPPPPRSVSRSER